MSSFSLRKQDPVLFTGLYAVMLSFGISLAVEILRIGKSASGTYGLYVIPLLIAVAYCFILMGSGRLKKGVNLFFPFLLLLILFLNSAYTLNREWQLFEIPTGWFCLALLLFCGTYIAIGVFTRIPVWIRFSLFAMTGTGICFLLTIKMNNIL